MPRPSGTGADQNQFTGAPRILPLAVAILAAGESRRMGSPKALLPYRGKTFVEHLLEVTRHPRAAVLRIVVGAHADEISAKLADHSESIVVNRDWQQGQLSSIQAAIQSLPTEATTGLLLCPVDHPIVSAALVNRLIREFDSSGRRIVLPVYRGRRGHPLIFHATLYEELLAASPELGARQVVWAHAAEVAEIATEEEGVILNLNDPETLRNATKEV